MEYPHIQLKRREQSPMKTKKAKIKPTLNVQQFVQEVTKEYTSIEDLKKEQFELGIDEAGRGPVLGSMIYSALWWPKKFKDKFKQIGFDDSKVLNENERDQLFEIINKMKGKPVFYQTQQLTAQYLSNKMMAIEGINLNILSHNAAVKLIRQALSMGFNITNIYVDTVGDPKKYKEYIHSRIPQFKCVQNITVQPKADRDHVVVSASSICAKVTRDKIIKEWSFPQNIEFMGELGSGYPSDPITKQWIQTNKHKIFGFPNLIRFSWNTCSNALENFKVLEMEEEGQQRKYSNLNYLVQGRKEMNRDIFNMIDE